MKLTIAATLAILMLSGISLSADAKAHHKADKKQIALTLQGGAAKDVDRQAAKSGIGSDESADYGAPQEMMIVGGGVGGGG